MFVLGQARHLILERLRGQAEQNDAVTSALEAAMLQCASARQGAAACLGLVPSGASDTKEDSGGVPMDVVDDLGGGGGIGVDGASGMSGVGVGKGNGLGGKGKLRAVEPAGVDESGR